MLEKLYGNERLLMLRIKLDHYVLSGNKEFNKRLASDLGNPNMDFTLPSHISICKFLIPKDSELNFDDFLKRAEIIFENINLKNIDLISALFIKRKDGNYEEIDVK